jgi:hypothetical protein
MSSIECIQISLTLSWLTTENELNGMYEPTTLASKLAFKVLAVVGCSGHTKLNLILFLTHPHLQERLLIETEFFIVLIFADNSFPKVIMHGARSGSLTTLQAARMYIPHAAILLMQLQKWKFKDSQSETTLS